jgi:hypothetical protein
MRSVIRVLMILMFFSAPPYRAAPLGQVAVGGDYGGYRPSYQGYGINTPAGRGGSVLRVTHLGDTTNTSSPLWAGSLRKALTAPGARFVVFEVSGTISLATDLIITNPFLTIAGQTAPSPGITLRNGYIQIDTHDVVIQHLRVRPGPTNNLPHGIHVRSNANNIVLDHVSVSWTVWTAIDLFAPETTVGIGDVTIIDSIVSEALGCPGVNYLYPCSVTAPVAGQHPNSRALLFGDNNTNPTYNNGVTRVALIRTLTAHNNDRQPEIQGDVSAVLVNNVVYNPSLTPLGALHVGDWYHRGQTQVAALGNVMIAGPTTPGNNGYVAKYYPEDGPARMVRIDPSIAPGSQIFLSGNYYARDCGGTACLTNPTTQWMLATDFAAPQGNNIRATVSPVSLDNLPFSSVMPYSQVEGWVLDHAGARPLDRDPVDTRIVRDVRNRTGSFINLPDDVGGYPVLAENHRSLSLPDNPHAVVDSAGRTRIELWLEGMARALEQ